MFGFILVIAAILFVGLKIRSLTKKGGENRMFASDMEGEIIVHIIAGFLAAVVGAFFFQAHRWTHVVPGHFKPDFMAQLPDTYMQHYPISCWGFIFLIFFLLLAFQKSKIWGDWSWAGAVVALFAGLGFGWHMYIYDWGLNLLWWMQICSTR